MKCLVRVALVLLIASAFLGCGRKPLTPVTPWADIANDSLCFFTVSTDLGGLKVCYEFDWDDGSKTTTDYFPSGDTCSCLHEFSDTRAHYIKVRARNEKGAASGWSPSLRFRLSEPPRLTDTICGLPRWASDRWYHASVRVIDPDADSVAVKFVWDDSLATGWSAFVPNGGTARDSWKWSTTGPHAVRVVLRDKGCTVTRPAAVKTVSISRMAVVWENYDEELCYSATPTLGSLNGEPVLYGVSYDDALDCFTLDGRRLWSAPLGCEPSGYAPSLTNDAERLYITCRDSVFSLDARTGQRKWSLSLSYWACCTPAIGPGNAIYVVTSDWKCELNRVRDCGDSAVVVWSIPLGDCGLMDEGAVVGRNGTVYAVGYDALSQRSFLVAADSAGNVLWRDSTRISEGGTPVIDGRDRVLVSDWSGYVYCFGPDGSLAWSTFVGELCPNSTAIGRNDDVIVTDFAGNIVCLDANGSQRWSAAVGTYGDNTPCVTDSAIVVYDGRGYVYGIGEDGGVLWNFSIFDSLGLDRRGPRRLEGDGCTSPVIGPNGDLYLADECCGMMCIAHGDLRLANTAWPTYNHDNAHSGWAGRH